MPPVGDITQFLGSQFFGKTFVPDVDLSGKIMIVTGGNVGLGLEAAKHLARHNVSKLILGCRNVSKGKAARTQILQETGHKTGIEIEVWQVDLTSFNSVTTFCNRVRAELPRLDAFIANAGVEMRDFELAEGLELSITVNVVSTFMMAIAALSKLRETSQKYNSTTNLEIVGSMIHVFGNDKELDVPERQDTLQALSDPKKTDMAGRYPLSKLIGHLCFNELSTTVTPQYKKENANVVLNLVNPGWCRTNLDRYNTNKGVGVKFCELCIIRTGEEGGRTLVHGVMSGIETNGCYLSECKIKRQSTFVRSDRGEKIQQKLWKETMARIRMASPEIADLL